MYHPLVGKFSGGAKDEIFWYGPGEGVDKIGAVQSNRTFTYTSEPVNGYYWPITGDFNGGGATDIFWYAVGN
jgi:hypothetical protein